MKISGAWNFKNDSFNGTFAPLKGQRLHQLLASAPWCRSLEEGLLRWPVESNEVKSEIHDETRDFQKNSWSFWCFSIFFYDHGKYLSPCEILKCPKLLLASVAFSQGRTPIDLINPLTSDPQAGAVGWNEQHLKFGTKIVRSICSMLGSSIDLQQRLIYKWKGIEETER